MGAPAMPVGASSRSDHSTAVPQRLDPTSIAAAKSPWRETAFRRPHSPRVPSLEAFGRRPRAGLIVAMAVIRNPSQSGGCSPRRASSAYPPTPIDLVTSPLKRKAPDSDVRPLAPVENHTGDRRPQGPCGFVKQRTGGRIVTVAFIFRDHEALQAELDLEHAAERIALPETAQTTADCHTRKSIDVLTSRNARACWPGRAVGLHRACDMIWCDLPWP